jgi:mono/diheme cytochrome c family protein
MSPFETNTKGHTMRAITCISFLTVALALAAPATAQDKIAAGKKVYADNKCAVCHSIGGVGNKKFPLDGAGKMSVDEIKGWLTDPKAEADKDGKKLVLPMKSYKTLPPADFDALVIYLQSLK